MTHRKHWYDYIPHPIIMLFAILVLVAVLTHILPAGVYERVAVNGQLRVVPGSYHTVARTPVGLFGVFQAFPAGFKTASISGAGVSDIDRIWAEPHFAAWVKGAEAETRTLPRSDQA